MAGCCAGECLDLGEVVVDVVEVVHRVSLERWRGRVGDEFDGCVDRGGHVWWCGGAAVVFPPRVGGWCTKSPFVSVDQFTCPLVHAVCALVRAVKVEFGFAGDGCGVDGGGESGVVGSSDRVIRTVGAARGLGSSSRCRHLAHVEFRSELVPSCRLTRSILYFLAFTPVLSFRSLRERNGRTEVSDRFRSVLERFWNGRTGAQLVVFMMVPRDSDQYSFALSLIHI